jgi:hypothetical protein
MGALQSAEIESIESAGAHASVIGRLFACLEREDAVGQGESLCIP